jgi:hypothetical protein
MNAARGATGVLEPIASSGTPRPFSLASIARHVASRIADAADADQWSISIAGIEEACPAEPAALVPLQWLIALNGGRAGLYRIMLILEKDAREFGIVRLATIRPCGFSPDDLAQAQATAEWAAEVLSEAS